mmetsp:Transcript_26476/g.36178  ORF Transcript_26476/g.36178 Transcript_26476/m.36178 type:complete len:351 (-) Transcript_26476:29-1081(-)
MRPASSLNSALRRMLLISLWTRDLSTTTSTLRRSTPTLTAPGLLASTTSSMVLPTRKFRPSSVPLLIPSGPSSSTPRTPLLTISPPTSTLVRTGLNALTLSTTSAINPTAVHAGLTVPPRLLTIDLASPRVSTTSSPFLIPLAAATSSIASLWVATVVRLLLPGPGLTLLVLLPVVTLVIMNSASTTPWPSALTTSPLPALVAAMTSFRSNPSARAPARPTPPSITLATRTSLPLLMVSEVSMPSSLISTSMVPSLLLSPSMRTSLPIRAVSTLTSLVLLSVATPSRPSVGVLRTVKTTGSALTPGTTPGVIRVPSRSRWVKLVSTPRCTPVSFENPIKFNQFVNHILSI